MTKGRSRFVRSSLVALMAGTALVPAAAMAQEASADAAVADEGGLAEILVTARKRTETTQNVPVSVLALSPEAIAKYDLTSLERVAAATPSFSIGRAPSGAGATLVLRGIGSNTTSIGLEQSVAVIVDGAYYGQGRVINEGFFDLGGLEILKGPQSLFFGKNATAGAVSITTADPGSDLEVIARAGYEFAGSQMIGEAIVSTPVTDTLGIRIAARASKMHDGYFDQIGTTQTYPTLDRTSTAQVVVPTNHVSGPAGDGQGDEIYIRGTVKWEPTDRLTATIKANFGENKNDNPTSNSVYYFCPTGRAVGNPAIPCGRDFRSSANRFPAALAASVPFANADGQTGNQYRSWAVNANITYDLDNFTITSVTNYQWNRNIFQFDGDSLSRSGPAGVFATEFTTWDAFSEELRVLSSFDGPFNFMIGGLYQKTKRDYLAWTASGGLENSRAPQAFQRYLANSKDSETDGETLSGFGQVIVNPIDEIELTAGVRYTHETKDSFFLQPYSHPIRVAQGIFLPGVTLTANQEFNDWSPEATISYRPTPDLNIWAAYKTAYKSGGFSNSGILSPNAGLADFVFDPERAEGFEGGIKSTLFDRQLRLNLTAYTYTFDNLQLDFFRSDIFAFTTINAGSAKIRGAELDFQFAPRGLDGFEVHGSVNYNHARYGDAPGAPCYAGQTRAQGCNLVFVNDGSADGSSRPFNPATDLVANRQNLKGQPTANAPEWTGNLGMSYEADVGEDLRLSGSVDARYSSSYLATAFANPFTRQEEYVNLDAALRFGTQDERWELAVIGRNLTNEWFAIGGNDAPNSGSGTGTLNGVIADQIGFANLPRTVQVQITFRY